MEKTLEYTSHVNKNKANIYLELCNEAEYSLHCLKFDKPIQNVMGYTPHKHSEKRRPWESNFKAVIYKKENENEYVIYFFGTNPRSIKDLYTDAKMGIKQVPKQFKDAIEFTQNFLNENPLVSPQNISLIGNSEGGSEVIYVKSFIPGIKDAYTYNTFYPTIKPTEETPTEQLLQNQQNIYNFRAPGDVVSKVGEAIGEEFIVDCKYDKLSIKEQHRITNFGDCNNGVSPAVYKQQHPKFKNKLRNEPLSPEDISSIPAEYYDYAEDDILASIAKFGIEQTNHCSGSYPVSGYTRQDGTKVPPHIRTCHAHGTF